MNKKQLAALLQHDLTGFSTNNFNDTELYELGLLRWVFPTHTTPGFYEISEKGERVIQAMLEFSADLV